MIHNIKWGDTLSALANKFGTSVSQLAQANGISNPNKIFAGATLEIPGGSQGSTGARRTGHPAGDSFDTQAPTGAQRPAGPSTGGVTQAELQRIMPNLSDAKAREYLPYLNEAMSEAKINTPDRQAAFLAQLAHESGQLQYMEEIASGAAYEGRSDLGNTQPGDGTRYKGRGPIQLTGRANYRAAGAALGIDLEGNPTRAANPDTAFRVAAWYWNSRNLNSYADQGNFSQITYRINGGYNGAADRLAYYNRAQSILA